MSAIYVEITGTRGSAPRNTGTAMKVTAYDTKGTIGGGALEFEAIATARQMLADGRATHARTIPLGPGLGQCCGGVVTLLFTRVPRRTDTAVKLRPLRTGDRTDPVPLWLWGAGHVGRAVARAAPPEAFRVTLIDDAKDRFPATLPGHVTPLPAQDMPLLATRTPQDVHHLIFTYAHDIDLALCAALLKRKARSLGVIGSDTKWARFSRRLREMGLDPAPVTCPIGDKALGKHPDAIAHGVLAALLARTQQKAPA